MERVQRLAFPSRFRVSLRDEPSAGAIALNLPARRMWPASLITFAMLAVFAGVEWTVIRGLFRHSIRDVSDLVFFLFQLFWVIGWSVGVAFLAALTGLLLLYGESARLENGRLVYTPHLGPLKIILDYDLSRVRNVRLENAGNPDSVRLRFDYDAGSNTLGDAMPRAAGELLMRRLQQVSAGTGSTEGIAPAHSIENTHARPVADASTSRPIDQTWASSLALLAANLVPLGGVLFFHWNLGNVMLLFWAESAIVGFYTVLKIIVAGRLLALGAAPFFAAHFGGFMAMHLLFIYEFFVRGLHPAGAEPGVRDALLGVFGPLWPSLAAMFISHGVSFFSNFIGNHEYESASVSELMKAPYNRVVVMHLAIIFGGWIIMLLHSSVGALALLVVLKTGLDLRAHRNEHAG